MIGEIVRNMKIRKKLILSYLLACVIPLILTCLIIYKVSAKNLEETTLELASALSSQIVTGIDEFIDEYDRMTKTVLVDNDTLYRLDSSGDYSVIDRVDYQLDLRKIMLRLVTMKPEIKNISFLTAADQFYQFNLDGGVTDKEVLKAQDWVLDMLATGETLMISAVHNQAYSDRHQDKIVITVGRKLFDYHGSYVGLLLIDIDSDSLIDLSDGFLLARNQYNIKINITSFNNGILYDSDVASGRVTWEEATSDSEYFLYQKNPQDFITLSSETRRAGLNVNVTIPKSNLLFKINRVGYVTVIAVMICILVILVTSTFFSRMITNPIGRLQKRMKQVEEGEYRELIHKDSDDEVGSLIQSYNHMVLRIKSLIEDVYLAEIKQKNARYLALKTQINPHMLYNTLESIRMKALVVGDDEVADMIKILARMFRMTLDEKPAPHRIQDEIEYVEYYLKLQNMRFADSFHLEVEMDSQVRQALIISMVLQPIIENSIEHGSRGYNKPLNISVKGEISEKNDIIIRISDDGIGMPANQINQLNGLLAQANADKHKLDGQEDWNGRIGLKNITERIKLYYGDQYYLIARGNKEKGTVIELCIKGQWSREEDESEDESV
ncbi:histidine kinase [Lachnospiraceae bacterium OttesenSCG-928-D06]|nr:histidine kinase [Lachnospiraceae bacterium OttesenSCG-928-D06]